MSWHSAHRIGIKRTAFGPDAFEAFRICLEKRAALDAPQVDDRRPESRHAVDVRIHQHLIIKTKDRIVKDSRVKRNAEVRAAENRPVPGQRVINPRG